MKEAECGEQTLTVAFKAPCELVLEAPVEVIRSLEVQPVRWKVVCVRGYLKSRRRINRGLIRCLLGRVSRTE